MVFSTVHLWLLVSVFFISLAVVFSSGIRMYLISVLGLSPQKLQGSSKGAKGLYGSEVSIECNDFAQSGQSMPKPHSQMRFPSPQRATIANAGLVSLLHRRTDRSHLSAISASGHLAAVFYTPKQALIFLTSHCKEKDMPLVLLVHLRHQVFVLLHFQLHFQLHS